MDAGQPSSAPLLRDHSHHSRAPSTGSYFDDDEKAVGSSTLSTSGAPSCWRCHVPRGLLQRRNVSLVIGLALTVAVYLGSTALLEQRKQDAWSGRRLAIEETRVNDSDRGMQRGGMVGMGDLSLAGDASQMVVEQGEPEFAPFDKLLVMNSLEPQDRMDLQLKNGVRYVTTVAYGGHANQFIALVKLLYLAKITNRVAILPTLIPLHFDADPVDFGSFFDLAPLRHYSQIPVVEFSELKPFDLSFQGAEMETLGCWSTQEATQGHPNSGGLVSMDIHQIGVTFWPLPPTLQRSGPDLAYEGLKIFDHERTAQDRWVDQVREEFLPQGLLPPPPVETEGGLSVSTFDKSTNVKPGFNPFSDPPSEQLVCYDNALFLSPLLFPDPFPGATDPLEPILPGEDPSWIEAGQFIHFSPHIEMLVDDYLRATLELSPNLRLPNLITVHLRRTDFLEFTGLTPLERYVLAVERARTRLAVVFPGREYEVLATTDEAVEGSDFIEHVRNLGWKVLDHDAMTTIATHGGWYPTILDAAILARGDGLVGTAKSTFSHLSGLRVKYWNGGVVELAL